MNPIVPSNPKVASTPAAPPAAPSPSQTSPAASPAASTDHFAPSSAAAPPAPTVWARTIKEEGPTFSVDMSVPQVLDPLNEKGSEALSDRLSACATRELNAFRGEYERPLLPDEMKGGVWEGYRTTFQNDRLLGLQIVSSEFTGGAHPLSGISTVLYDRKEGRELNLGDLFKQGSDYLGTISKSAIESLSRQDSSRDMGWVRQGAAPQAENFSAFTPTPEGLKFTFQQYQVDSYASGTPEVTVPWSALQSMLRPDSAVMPLATAALAKHPQP